MLETAMDIVLTQGLEALTIVRLAKALDRSVGGLYRYFPHKQAIIVALQERAILALRADMLEALETCQDSNPLCRVIAIGDFYLQERMRSPSRHRLIDMLLSTPQAVLDLEEAQRVEVALHEVLGVLEDALETCVARGMMKPGDATSRTHTLWAMLHGLDHFRKRDRLQKPELQVAALFRASLLTCFQGWGVPAEEALEAFRISLDQCEAINTSS